VDLPSRCVPAGQVTADNPCDGEFTFTIVADTASVQIAPDTLAQGVVADLTIRLLHNGVTLYTGAVTGVDRMSGALSTDFNGRTGTWTAVRR
jgi:hypothetical protein